MVFSKGDLVVVRTPHGERPTDLCVVVATTVPCVYKLNEFFMVYSVVSKERFITTKNFMKKIVDRA